MRRVVATAAAVLLLVAAGCGDDDDDDDAAAPTTAVETTAESEATVVDVTARDYTFDVPDSVEGGTVELRYRNDGKEPHFAGLLKLPQGKTVADVTAFFSGPPAGPPPFEEVGGLATADPGARGNETLELDAGEYAFFCAIPSPDGQSHLAKGMITQFTVTPGDATALPEADETITGRDFAYATLPTLEAGTTVVEFENQGTQFHEIQLVELQEGKTVADVTKFLDSPTGAPPARFLSGAAIKPGGRATSRLELEAGRQYAFLCGIPDPTDGKPHYAKGMVSPGFTV